MTNRLWRMYLTCSPKKQFAHREKEIVKSENGVDERKKNRYIEEQIAFTRKHAELGTPISEVCRKFWIMERMFYH